MKKIKIVKIIDHFDFLTIFNKKKRLSIHDIKNMIYLLYLVTSNLELMQKQLLSFDKKFTKNLIKKN